MYDFTETEIPQLSNGRTAEPNPLDNVIKALAANRSQAMETVIKASNAADLDKELAKFTRHCSRGGTDHNVSVRKSVIKNAKKTSTKVKIWAVDKISRPRKDDPSNTDTDAK